MTTLSDLFNLTLFDAMIDGGYVRVQHHPTLPLHIANYAEKAQYEHVWNDVTLTCRGLIYDDAQTVVARPYRKFFNYGDDENTGPLDLDAPVVVTDKLDGSLGIGFATPHGAAIATRGSFTSDQALHATALLRDRYPDFAVPPGATPLFEIIYRDNRIVVDYGDQDDLVIHGVMDIPSGRLWPQWETELLWTGPAARTFKHATLTQALADEPRPNAEGLVVRYADSDVMVKLKQADYVALHRIVTGLNARTVWEWLGDGKTVGDLCVTVPDEFHEWIESVATELDEAAAEILHRASVEHDEIMAGLDIDHTRGDYARVAARSDVRSYLFMVYDGEDRRARELAWRSVKPSGARSMVNHSEAVA